jgi:hypothetical protein
MHAVYDKITGYKKRREIWLELLAQYCVSGLSKKDFAKNNGIKLDDLCRWHYRYKEKSAPPKFSPIKVIAPIVKIASPIVLKIGSQYCIELAADFDAATLSRILAVIGPRTC